METLSVQDIIGIIALIIALIATITAIAGALKAGVIRRIRIGRLEIEAPTGEAKQFREAAIKASTQVGDIPFEIEQLTNYYSQILAQSKISFWFSLVFASLGFAIIVVAAFLYNDGSGAATVAQFTAGIIMDAVAGLFFVQSRNAQKSMAEFFDKLRNDRLHMESRRLVDTVSNIAAQDALRVHLSLHYAGVENAEGVAKGIADTCLSENVRP